MSDIDARDFGRIEAQVEALQVEVHQLANDVKELLELVGLTGSVAYGIDPTINTSYSTDGETWSQQKFIKAGTTGQRAKRLVWFQQGWMRNWRIQRFQGTSDAHMSFARLEAAIEPLAY